jgi:ABC-2 type transport system permease protein
MSKSGMYSNLNVGVIWVLVKREILAFWRSKIRIITSIAQGFLFLFIFSASLAEYPIFINGVRISSTSYIASGICAMAILFTGIFGGLGLMRDKMFGFMKELMAAPVSRRTLMFGKTLGVTIQTVIQSVVFLIASIILGFFSYEPIMIVRVLLIIPVALLASIGVVGLGLIVSTRLRDFQSFGLIQTFIVMPLFWLSGALLAVDFMDNWMQIAMKFNPYTYVVDLFRVVLLGVSYYPIWLNLVVITSFGTFMILLGAWSFNKMEVSQ